MLFGSEMVDRALIARCLDGESGAWHELIMRYQGLIYSVARLYLKSAGAEDIFQEVCMELYRRLDTIHDVQSLPAWLITVTRRKCAGAVNHIVEFAEVEVDNLVVVDQSVAQIENRFWIEQSLVLLNDKERSLIHALYFDPAEPSYAEIASRLNIPVASIGPTRARCLEKLRKGWEGARDPTA